MSKTSPTKDAPSTPVKTSAKAAAKKTAAGSEKSGSTTNKKALADLSAGEIAEIRTQLVTEMSAMRIEYDELMLQVDQLQQDHTDGAGDDQADAGSKTFEREQQISIASNRFDLLTQMQHALERIDAGTYGRCEMCGKAIPRARLQAFPMATLDVVCKQREERR
ncbi:MAG: molecular chaperone DnaK-like protein [Pseudonocardiales bacterium]|nr:molecular chaperone DnaK-like protein [Pseudonocardiales bacterium]